MFVDTKPRFARGIVAVAKNTQSIAYNQTSELKNNCYTELQAYITPLFCDNLTWMFKCKVGILCRCWNQNCCLIGILVFKSSFKLKISITTEFIINKRGHLNCQSVIEPSLAWHLLNPNFVSNVNDLTTLRRLFLDSILQLWHFYQRTGVLYLFSIDKMLL